ncbi:hypothetical protein HPP92_017890 [Vanilla planifolia]|uniref:Uncharacterized protein n=1 Tax=Vanilla planifolia TaxID=51239 RepID=A0A835Q4S3_VANPL|nr:hypothetical protein HPP92_017890 [Vanilla planifolia]
MVLSLPPPPSPVFTETLAATKAPLQRGQLLPRLFSHRLRQGRWKTWPQLVASASALFPISHRQIKHFPTAPHASAGGRNKEVRRVPREAVNAASREAGKEW